MHMSGVMMPKRGQLEFLARISIDALWILPSEVDHMFTMVSCPYMGLDCKGCPNILFIAYEPRYHRGNIFVLFKLI